MLLKHRVFGLEIKSVTEEGRFEGYLSYFGNLDSYKDIVAPGAFSECLAALKAAGSALPILWQHNPDWPIGVWTSIEEDATGLRVTGQLVMSVRQAAETYALIKAGAIKGLSIGYYVRASSFDEKTGITTLTQIELVEGSVVTFPANASALIDTVKAKLDAGELPTIREFENYLREVGFSKTQAAAIAVRGFKALERDAPSETAEATPINISALDSALTVLE